MTPDNVLMEKSPLLSGRKEKPISLGIIGFGNIGRLHFYAATSNPLLKVLSVADPCLSHKSTFDGSIQFFDDWKELLNQAEIDAVSICVPHYLHAPIASAALVAGKHVLLEKPLGLNVEEGKNLIEIAEQEERMLMVEMTHRFYPAMREARAFVQNGQLGEIYAVEDRIVETANSQITSWFKNKATAGGGVALTNGIHMVDRIAAITGQQLKFVSGHAGYSAQMGDVEDTAAMLFTLENGAPVQIFAAWPKGHRPSDDELTIYGTKGTLRVWAWRGWRFEPINGEAAQEHFIYSDKDNLDARVQSGVANALQEFAAALAEKRDPNPPATAALKAQMLIEEFYDYEVRISGGRPSLKRGTFERDA
jgi:predicted dehydrogenase